MMGKGELGKWRACGRAERVYILGWVLRCLVGFGAMVMV